MSVSNKNKTASKAAPGEAKQAGKSGTKAGRTSKVVRPTRVPAKAPSASAQGTGKGVERAAHGLSSALPHEPSALLNPTFNPTLDVLLRDGVPSVFLDANILIPEYLRAVFLDLAYAGLLEPHWSKGVLEETRRNLVDLEGRYALDPKGVDKTLRDMEKAFPRALALGSEKYDAAFSGRTDAKDQHVAAGALKVSRSVYGGRAVVLVTSNAADLPQWAFEGSQVLVVRPDLFLVTLLRYSAKKAVKAIDKMLARFKSPSTSQVDLLNILIGAGCHGFAFELASLWGYEMETSLTPARQQQLPNALRPPSAAKRASTKTPAKRAPAAAKAAKAPSRAASPEAP